MKFTIHHVTTYTYSAPVRLDSHLLRFRPRYDGGQEPRKFKLQVQPKPSVMTEYLGPEGNLIAKAWFAEETKLFRVDAYMEVETLRENPFDYLVEPSGRQLPMHYEAGLDARLLPYLKRINPRNEVDSFAWEIADAVDRESVPFIGELNRRLYDFAHETREEGNPLPPVETLHRRAGACRDLTVLFMDACRAVGLAVRFVSGYQKEPEHHKEKRYLHAWPEVYLPGGGWRGYDPTHGLAVSNEHVAVAAAPMASKAAPIEGGYHGPPDVTSQIQVDLSIEVEP